MLRKGVALLLACMLAEAGAIAGERPAQVTWANLSPLVTGHRISTALPDGTRLEGIVREVTADSLVVDGKKGTESVPRASISRLRMKRTGYKWKVAGTAIGAGGGLALGLPIRAYANNEGARWDGIIAAAIAVPIALGFLAGYAADRKVIEIVVQP